MLLIGYFSVNAQPVLTPLNVALGGGGSTYITDYNANFYNPANLFIKDRLRNFDLGIAITGTYFNGVQNFANFNKQRTNFKNYIYAFKPGSYVISTDERAEIIEENYIKNRSTSLHQTRLDVILFGFKIRTSKRAISFAIRNRISSSFEVGRGWYTHDLQLDGDISFLDRSLTHRYQSLYELSLGFAETFHFFTDMTPRLDNLTIGFAPKLVMAGSNLNARWNNRYEELQDGNIRQIQDLNYQDSGTFTNAMRSYLNGMPAQSAIIQNVTDELFDHQGIGAGIDIGFTYLLTLGSDFSTIEEIDQRTQKSLRIAFSITDIGFVNYNKTSNFAINSDTTNFVKFPVNLASEAFVGAPGQFLDFVDQFSVSNPIHNATSSKQITKALLPTAIHAGILLEVNRLKMIGDLSLGLSNNAFNSTKLVTSVGVEIRALKFLPLRAGTQLATELPNYFSFGMAVETKVWDLSIATQFISRTFNENPTLSGVTVAALQFHF